LFGYWDYEPFEDTPSSDSIPFKWFDTPLRVYEDGRVNTHIWTPMEGDFRADGSFALGPMDEEPDKASPLEHLVFTPNDGSRRIDRVMGVFPVNGYSGKIPWNGVAAVVSTPYTLSQGGPLICRLWFSVTSESYGELRGATACSISGNTGILTGEPFVIGRDSAWASGSLLSGLLELTITRQVTAKYYQAIHVRGAAP
jgi:hypothetical protein